MKTLIGVPCADTIKSRTAFALMNLQGTFHVVFQVGSDIADNRNKLVQQALDGRYNYLLFVDSDMVFNSDMAQEMLARCKSILGLAANRRKLPLESVAKPMNWVGGALPTTMFEAESCGTGVMLINIDVFKTMNAPWFEFSYGDDGKRVGEDVNFCLKARARGYKVYVDPTIPVGHLGEYQY